VFMDVEFINQQGVLNAMHHHTDLKKKTRHKNLTSAVPEPYAIGRDSSPLHLQ
jgi:hypothetical protein